MRRLSISKIDHITLNIRSRPVSVADLALMLEVDLSLGYRKQFRARLQRSLDDAKRQGMAVIPSRKERSA